MGEGDKWTSPAQRLGVALSVEDARMSRVLRQMSVVAGALSLVVAAAGTRLRRSIVAVTAVLVVVGVAAILLV